MINKILNRLKNVDSKSLRGKGNINFPSFKTINGKSLLGTGNVVIESSTGPTAEIHDVTINNITALNAVLLSYQDLSVGSTLTISFDSYQALGAGNGTTYFGQRGTVLYLKAGIGNIWTKLSDNLSLNVPLEYYYDYLIAQEEFFLPGHASVTTAPPPAPYDPGAGA